MRGFRKAGGAAAAAVILACFLAGPVSAATADLMPSYPLGIKATEGGIVTTDEDKLVFRAGSRDATFTYSVDTELDIGGEIYCYYDVTATGGWDIQWKSTARNGSLLSGFSWDFGQLFGKGGKPPNQYGSLIAAGHYDNTLTEMQVDVAWKWNNNVPEDGKVTITSISIKVEAGSELTLEELSFAPKDGGIEEGDVYETGDYRYKYNYFWDNGWGRNPEQNGWGVRAINNCQTSYGLILSEIGGKPVVNMTQTFQGCIRMKEAPAIPDGVTHMDRTFWGCFSLERAPVIPHKVTHMKEAFSGAMQLAGEVTIPETVEDMRACFDGTVQPITMLYSAGCRAAEEYLVPANVKKVTLGEEPDPTKTQPPATEPSVEGTDPPVSKSSTEATSFAETTVSSDSQPIVEKTEETVSLSTASRTEGITETTATTAYSTAPQVASPATGESIAVAVVSVILLGTAAGALAFYKKKR